MKLKNNFAITGFMGAGKSTLFEEIKNEVTSFDLDQLIYKEVGSIKRYIENTGEDSFRSLEFQTLKLLENLGPHLVFLGGGSLESPKTFEYIQKSYKLIYLKVDLNIILNRMNEYEKNSRPLFKNAEELYDKRQDQYLKSEYIIDGNQDLHKNIKELKEIIFE